MNFLPARKSRGLIINVTSLIDVMFLLLIFFMVTSTFKNQPAITLVLPRSTTATETLSTPAIVYLTADGTVYLNDAPVPEDGLSEALERIQGTTGEDSIVLRADERAEHGDVVRLIDILKQSGFTRVSISARAPAGP